MTKQKRILLVEDTDDHELFLQAQATTYSTSLNALNLDETFRFAATCLVRKLNSFGELKDILTKNMFVLFLQPDRANVKGNFVINPGKAHGT